MPEEDGQHLQKHIIRTLERVQEIETGPGSKAEKQTRAAVNVCFLLQEIAATSFSLDAQTEIHKLTALFQNM